MDIELIDYKIKKLDYRKVHEFQGNLKEELSPKDEKKLLKSLKDKGKFVPETVWYDKNQKKYFSIDGHRRLSIYKKHQIKFNGSFQIPFLLVEAEDEKDAKEKLLILNSHYGKITRQGLMDFSKGLSVDWMNMTLGLQDFPQLNFLEEARKMEQSMNSDFLQNNRPESQNQPPTTQEPQTSGQNAYEERGGDFHGGEDYSQYQEHNSSGGDDQSDKDDYVSFTEILKAELKIKLVDTIANVKRGQSLSSNAEALEFILDKFHESYPNYK